MLWSDSSILKVYPNTCIGHKHTLRCEELTFYGFPNQPDFAIVTVSIEPRDSIIDLKSWKLYLLQFRDKHMSYERILNTIFEDLKDKLNPYYLEIMIQTQPRGGVSSVLSKSLRWS